MRSAPLAWASAQLVARAYIASRSKNSVAVFRFWLLDPTLSDAPTFLLREDAARLVAVDGFAEGPTPHALEANPRGAADSRRVGARPPARRAHLVSCGHGPTPPEPPNKKL